MTSPSNVSYPFPCHQAEVPAVAVADDVPTPRADKYAVKRTAAETFAADREEELERIKLAKQGLIVIMMHALATHHTSADVAVKISESKTRAADAFNATVIRNEVSDNCVHEVCVPRFTLSKCEGTVSYRLPYHRTTPDTSRWLRRRCQPSRPRHGRGSPFGKPH